MLPGFRFLFAAIVLSVSILIFGLGAAALLRAAHEEFASNPTWRAAPEQRFAQQKEPSQPVLAVLRVEPQPAAQKAAEPERAEVPASPPAPESTASAAPAEPEAVVTSTPEAEKVAALSTPDAPAEATKTEAQPAEAPVASDAAPTPPEETKVATTEEAKPSASEALPAAPEAAKSEPANADVAKSEAVSPESAIVPTMPAALPAVTKLATLVIPAGANENTAPKREAGEQAERSVEKARLRAQARARARRRLLARARLLRQQQLAQQQTIGLLGQTLGPTPARTP
jgi:hypothetical protein